MVRSVTALGFCFAVVGILPIRREVGPGPAEPSQADVSCVAELASKQELTIEIAFSPVRAAAFLSYREAGIGEVRIVNRGAERVRGLALTVELPGERDLLPDPFQAELPEIAPGAALSVRILARFGPAILEAKTAEHVFRAVVRSGRREVASRESLVPIVEPSAVTWDVPERIAALVDPEPLLALVRSAIRSIEEKVPARDAVPLPNLQLSADAFDALETLGLRYMEDAPNTGAGALLGVPVDRVSSPIDTLRSRSGDCDDLSVLLASALEAAGVPAAFGIAESHVFVLFELGARDLAAAPVDRAEVLERGGRAWVPLEATLLARPGATLRQAWVAARGRLEGLRRGEARFFEIRKAWTSFPTLPRASLHADAAASAGTCSGGASVREAARLLHQEAARRAAAARGDTGPAGGDTLTGPEADAAADRREASVMAAAGYRSEAAALLRKALAAWSDPAVHLDLASLLLADPRAEDLLAARREAEEALRELDPLDLPARDEAMGTLRTIADLEGTKAEAMALAARDALPDLGGETPAGAIGSGRAPTALAMAGGGR